MATQNVKSSTKDVYVNRSFDNPVQSKIRFFTWAEITAFADVFLLTDVPAKSVVLACYVVVTTAFATATAITGGTWNGTEDDADLYWDATTGAIANFAIRSMVGAFSPRQFSTTAADFEVKLNYDTLTHDIGVDVTGADLTAGEGYLVVDYLTLVTKAK